MIPPQEIDDPTDSKPEDWVDTPKIPDPDAVKPDDWDESAPQMVSWCLRNTSPSPTYTVSRT